MFEKVKNLLLYYGASRDEYDRIKHRINEANQITLLMFTGLTAILFLVLLVLSSFMTRLNLDRNVYLFGLDVSLGLFLVSILIRRFNRQIAFCVPVVCLVLYSYGILVGITHGITNRMNAFIVALVLLPNLLVDYPLRMIGTTAFSVCLFIYLCFKAGISEGVKISMVNSVFFGIFGIAIGTFTCTMQIKRYLSELKLREMSHFDKLTGLKNRNAFETELGSIAERCEKSLACIYVDVNCLKRLNDDEGHKRGDEMLVVLANEIRQHFGEELTYRIGGDEFNIFVTDPAYFEIKKRTDELIEKIEADGYHISVGWKVCDLNDLSMTTLIEDAEGYMYQKKTEFYKNSKYDRRR